MRLFLSLPVLLSLFFRITGPVQVFIDGLERKITTPIHPKRIVSLHDFDITIPLIGPGVPPVASHGRIRPDSSHFIRFSALLIGIDFDSSPTAFIGIADIDIEVIVVARPDLIITEPTHNTSIGQLRKIMPAVSIDHPKGGVSEIYHKLVKLTGTQSQPAIFEHRYQAQVNALKATLDSQKIAVSVIQTNQGKINIMYSYHSLGWVLRDIGFRFLLLIGSIPEGGRVGVSAECLPELDTDFAFATWHDDTDGKPQDGLAVMERVMPGWCQFLTACRSGRYMLIPREEVASNSFASLELMVVQT